MTGAWISGILETSHRSSAACHMKGVFNMAKGSVSKKKGRKKWYYRFYITGEDGKPKQIERAGTESKAETERMLRKAMEEYESKLVIAQNSNLTLAEVIDMWLEEGLKPSSLANGTVHQYMTKANKIKRHPLAQRKLKAVTSSQLQAYIDFLSFGGTDPNGAQAKPIASGTVNVYMAMLHKVFKFAIYSKRILTANPMDYVEKRTKPADCDIFQNGESQDAGQVLSLEQYRILTDYLRKRGNPCLLAVQISYYAGLRLGEVLGLAWEDIDLEKQCMTICRSLSYSSSRKATSLGPTKTKKTRTVDFGDTLAEILRRAKMAQARESLRYGPMYKVNYVQRTVDRNRTYNDLRTLSRNEAPPKGYIPINLVCVRHDGEYQRQSTITSLCQDLSKSLPGLGHFHFHQLRHTYTSNLLANGATPKDVQELLGHADIRTTMNVYAHAERDSKRATARLLDKLASGE